MSCQQNPIIFTPPFPSATSGGGGGGAPSGPAGGDLGGTYPNPIVDGLQGVGVSAAAPASGDFLRHDGTVWEPAVITSGDLPASVMESGDAAGGDLTGTYPSPTLVASGVTAATYGSATQVPVITVDAKGRATGIVNTAISVPPSGSAGGDLSGTYPNPTFRNSVARSVIGRSAATAGAPADIQATTDGTVLGRVGGVVGFNTVQASAQMVATSVLGRSAGTAGAGADIQAITDGTVLGRVGGVVGFNTVQASTQMMARSVLGRSAGTAGAGADIQATVDGTVLGRVGGVVGFNTVQASTQMMGTSVLGRSAGTAGAGADIQATVDGQVLKRSGGAVAFAALTTSDLPSSVVTNATAAGGDLSGTYPSPTVDALQGYPISPTPPTVYHVLQSNGASWIAALVADNNIQNAGISAHLKVIDNTVTDAKLRVGVALSVIGRSANSTGNVANIAAVDGSGGVLRESGSVLGFGTIATAGIADGAVTSAKLASEASWKKYAVTLADLVNSASEVDIISATIPANEWSDGEIITIDAIVNGKNNTGANHTVTVKVYYDGTTSTILSAGTIYPAGAEGPWRIQLELWRVGANVFVRWGQRDNSGIQTAAPSSLRQPANLPAGFPSANEYTGDYGDVWVAPGFSTSKAVKISAQWDAADAELFMKVWAAKVWKW